MVNEFYFSQFGKGIPFRCPRPPPELSLACPPTKWKLFVYNDLTIT